MLPTNNSRGRPMLIKKQNAIRDNDWRKRQGEEECFACGAEDGTVVGAHVRIGSLAGVGRKPSDNLIVPLCYRCHSQQHEHGELSFWVDVFAGRPDLVIDGIRSIAMRRYREFKDD